MNNLSRKLKLHYLFAFIFWISASQCILLSQTNTSKPMPLSTKMDQAANHLSEFETNKSIDQLEYAMEAMEQAPQPHPKTDKTDMSIVERRQQTRMWLTLLETIEKNQDPKFDENEVIEMNIIPPPSDGVQLPSGVDPNAIKDPAVRAEYEEALKVNKQKIERFNFQLRLQRLHRHVSVDAERVVRSFYDSSEADREELETILSQSKLSAAQKQKLKDSVSSK